MYNKKKYIKKVYKRYEHPRLHGKPYHGKKNENYFKTLLLRSMVKVCLR